MMAEHDNIVDGRYQLDVELGRGGFGAVYRAKQLVLGVPMRDVALKLFHEGAITPQNVWEKMNDAISLIGLLEMVDDVLIRQHFISIYDLGATREASPQAFIAMELVRGGSLQRRLQGYGQLNVKGTLEYLLQITRAIGFMHTQAKPILHRDLKPDNLLVVRQAGRDLIKVADFGLAAALDGALAMGQAAGALQYMAPEGFEYSTAVPASDVYSIGLIAYEMLFGKHPFENVGRGLSDKNPDDHQKIRQQHIDSRKAWGGISREKAGQARDLSAYPLMIDVLNKSLAYEIGDRYLSARRMRDDLVGVWKQAFPGEPVAIDEPSSEPAGPPAGSDLLRELKERIGLLLRHKKYPQATLAARQMTDAFPVLCDGYLAAVEVTEAQAESLSAQGPMAAIRTQMLVAAADSLRKGLTRVLPDHHRQMKQCLARLYQKMGDPATAARLLNESSTGSTA